MRRAGVVSAAVGHGPGDHVCWVYDGEEAWRDLAAVFLHDGAPAHDGLLYVGGKDEAGLLDDLAGLPGRDRMVRTGQLRVLPLDRPDGRRSAFEGERHLATYRSESDRALAAGYRSLRVAVDLSPLAAGPADGPRLAAFELLVDALVDRAPLSALCGYDAAVVHRTATDDAALVHPLRNDGPHGPAGAVYADGPGRWRLTGEIDAAAHLALESALASLPATADVHFDLADLDFIDLRATRALVRLAGRLRPGRRLVLHDPPEILSLILESGWGDVPALQVVPS